MKHIAIDLGSRESQVCVRGTAGEILSERKIATRSLTKFLATETERSRVILETSAEAFHVADAARANGHEVRVVSAHLVRAIGVGARGIKTDERDARALSEVSTRIDLPSVHVPSQLSRERKALCRSRSVLVGARTKLTNHVRGMLRTQAIVVVNRRGAAFPNAVRKRLLELGVELPVHLERVLASVESLNVQIKQADEELAAIAKTDPVCQRLMTVPGVGPLIAIRFLATLDEAARFHGAHGVMSYLGLTPGESSSATRKHRTAITKAGASELRFALVQGAWVAMRTRRGHPMVDWALEIAKRRGKNNAVVALARKMAGILFAIVRDGTSYEPSRGAQPIEPPATPDAAAEALRS